jgi:hypothetical protein
MSNKKTAETLVYCGPTVPDVAPQYTVYSDGLPKNVIEFAEKHPAVKGLIVPLDQLASVRARLEQTNSAENILYRKVKAEL